MRRRKKDKIKGGWGEDWFRAQKEVLDRQNRPKPSRSPKPDTETNDEGYLSTKNFWEMKWIIMIR